MLKPHEQEAYARVFLPDVLAYAERRSRFSQGDAESAALVGLTRALRSWNPDGRSTLRTWVFSIVHHELQHDRRDGSGVPRRDWEAFSGRMEDMPEQYWRPLSIHGRITAEGDCFEEFLMDPCPLPGDELANASWLADALSCLSPRQQTVIRECVIEGRAQETVGREIGISQMHVSREKRTALAVLRKVANHA